MFKTPSIIAFVSLFMLSAACSSPEKTELECPKMTEGASVFIALDCHFNAYSQWKKYTFDESIGSVSHAKGVRDIYISSLPPKGSAVFPVGTMIVKQLNGSNKFHAMVKRGGSFNEAHNGWEWLEFQLTAEGVPVNLWRGEEPGLGYTDGLPEGVDPATEGNCNECHGADTANDYVKDSFLRLSSF